MILNINHEREIENPDDATIERELAGLTDDEFAILAQDDEVYLQTLVDPDAGLILEYQEGSIQEHFNTVDPPGSIQEVIAAFISYSNGTDAWKTQFEWERTELTQISFTVIVSAAPDAIDQIDDPFDLEDRIELPHVGVDHLIALYELLVDAGRSLAEEFNVIGETTPEGLDEVILVQVPSGFQTALADLSAESIGSIALKWQATEGFPIDEYNESAVTDVVDGLSAMASDARDSGNVLIACDLQ